MRTTIRQALVIVVSVIALTVGAVPMVSAAGPDIRPADTGPCYHSPSQFLEYVWADCDGNSGEFRAVAYCRERATGRQYVTYGAWIRLPSSNISKAYCLPNTTDYPYDSAVQTSS